MNKEIEVLVSLTLSKSIKIKVDDYDETIEKDEDGKYSIIDYSNCNLINAVKDQVYLPYEAGRLFNICLEEKQLPTIDKINDLSNWNVDDFEVVME